MIADKTRSVLERVVAGEKDPLDRDAARQFLQWQFSEADHRRMDELAVKVRGEGLSEEESAEYDEFCVVADLLSLLHVRAQAALRQDTELTGT